MIFTTMGEPVTITEGPLLDLLDPTTQHPLMQYVVAQSIADPTWTVRRRVCELKADGGLPEIQAALEALQT